VARDDRSKGTNMTKRQKLIDNLSDSHKDLSKEDMHEVVLECFDYLGGELASGNRIEIRGFGALEPSERKVSSPFSTKDSHTRKTIKYKISKNILEEIN
jgi:nucleoid DNA-binding protein